MPYGQRIGYIRVSSTDQNTARQLEGLVLDKTFTDKASGKSQDRTLLKAMLGLVREGDEVYVHSMDRLARNLVDLLQIVKNLTSRGVAVIFMKEGQTFTGEDNSMSKLMLGILGSVAEFERAMIKERQREGIAIAKKKGVYKGRKPSLSAKQVAEVWAKIVEGETVTKIAKDYGVARQTIYKALKTPP